MSEPLKKMLTAALIAAVLLISVSCRETADDGEESGTIYFSSSFIVTEWELASIDLDNRSSINQLTSFNSTGAYILNSSVNPVVNRDSGIIIYYSSGDILRLHITDENTNMSPPGFNTTYAAKPSPDQQKVLINNTGANYAIYNRDETSFSIPDFVPSGASPDPNMITWAPDSDRVAVVSEHTAFDEIFTYTISSGSIRQLTSFNGTYSVSRPAWSPDSEWIAADCNYYDPAYRDIILLKPDGSYMDRLTTTTGNYKTTPVWSPDGKSIAHLVDNGVAVNALAVTGFEDRVTNVLTQHAGGTGVSGVSWSPYGTKIVFSADWTGSREIYMIDSDGGGLEQLTFGGTESYFPVWVKN